MFAVLLQPINVRTVWTNSEQTFYICWELPIFGSHVVDYNIFDARLAYLNPSDQSCSERSCCANLSPPTSEDTVFIQVTSPTALPSVPLLVSISGKGNFRLDNVFLLYLLLNILSEAGVSLMFNGTKIDNGSALSIDLIGKNELALICKTSKRNCCAIYGKRQGEWYYSNGSQIPNKDTSSTSFYRDRTNTGEVRLNKHSNMPITPGPGMYCCETPESDANCGIIQRICINLGEYSNCIPPITKQCLLLFCSISCDQITWK
jgi:hypothetical protein